MTSSSRWSGFIAKLADREDPGPFSRTGWIVAAAALVVLMLPTLALPLGPDQSLFVVSGQKILQGGLPYRDFIDIKPPLIYYIYAFAVWLFGSGPVSLRLLDMIVQLATCWLMIRLIRRSGGSDLTASLAPAAYLLAYLGQGYAVQAVTESYVTLMSMGIMLLWLYHRTRWGFLGMGLLNGVLLILKPTLGVMLAATLAAEWILFPDEGWRRKLSHVFWIVLGFLLMGLLLAGYLFATDTFGGFMEVNHFIRGYGVSELGSLSLWMKNLASLVPHHLGVDYSLVLLIGFAVGVGRSVEMYGGGKVELGRVLAFCLIAFVALMGSIAAEGKYHYAHMTRYYGIAAVVSAVGIVELLRWVTRWSRNGRKGYRRLVGAVSLLCLIVYSPLAPYFWRTFAIGVKNIQRNLGQEIRESALIPDRTLDEVRAVASYVVPRYRKGDRIMAAAGLAGMIYHECAYIPEFRLYHSAFLISPFGPPRWKEESREYVLEIRPRFIVAQINDSLPSLTGSDMNALQALRALPGVAAALDSNYVLVLKTESLNVYERRGN